MEVKCKNCNKYTYYLCTNKDARWYVEPEDSPQCEEKWDDPDFLINFFGITGKEEQDH